jgi:hypothetical protein
MWHCINPEFLIVQLYPKQQAIKRTDWMEENMGKYAGEGSISARDVEGMDEVSINCAVSVVWKLQTTLSHNKGLCSLW